MTVPRNPKLDGAPFWDCIVQKGPCPMNCNQCFFNRPGAYYVPLDELPLIPDPVDVGDDIVRMNCGHDSNIDFDDVVLIAGQYKHVFFNTAIPKLSHFPGPVVFTANPREEKRPILLAPPPKNLMFIRLRTSGTNLHWINDAIEHYTTLKVPVVITMMAYYDRLPSIFNKRIANRFGVGDLTTDDCYEWKVRHINSYWCPTPALIAAVIGRYADNRLVTLCGSRESYYCRDCRNCETRYIQTLKYMRGE